LTTVAYGSEQSLLIGACPSRPQRPSVFGRFTHRLICSIERSDILCSGSSQKLVLRLIKGANVDMLVPGCGRPRHATNEGSERGSSYARLSHRYPENDEAHKDEKASTHQPIPAPGFAQSSRMFALTAYQRPPALMERLRGFESHPLRHLIFEEFLRLESLRPFPTAKFWGLQGTSHDLRDPI
jgi:hypothetical protein